MVTLVTSSSKLEVMETAKKIVLSLETAKKVELNLETAKKVVLSWETVNKVVLSLETAKKIILSLETAKKVVLNLETAQKIIVSLETDKKIVSSLGISHKKDLCRERAKKITQTSVLDKILLCESDKQALTYESAKKLSPCFTAIRLNKNLLTIETARLMNLYDL